MADIMAKLRYFPLGPISGVAVPIQQPDLEDIAAEHGVLITLDNIEGKDLEISGATRPDDVPQRRDRGVARVIGDRLEDRRRYGQSAFGLTCCYRSCAYNLAIGRCGIRRVVGPASGRVSIDVRDMPSLSAADEAKALRTVDVWRVSVEASPRQCA